MTVPFQVPVVIVPNVAISVPISFAAAIVPDSILFVTLLAPIVVLIPVEDTSPVKLPVKVAAVPVMFPVIVPEVARLPVILTLPVTSSFAVGVAIPIPTLPVVVSEVPALLKARLVPVATPSTGVVEVGLVEKTKLELAVPVIPVALPK